LNPEIVSKLQSNQSKALEKASKSSDTGSLGAFLFSENDAAGLFTSLSDEEKRQVEGLTRTLEVGMGASLERFSLRWNGYEDSFKGTDAGPEGGYSRVIDALAESFTALGGEIRTDTPVLGLNPATSGEGVDIYTSTGNAGSDGLSARLVICTIPLAVLQKSHKDLFHAPLSLKKVEAIEKTHVGQLGKIVLSYDQAWWPTDVGAFTILPTASPSSQEEAPPKDARALLNSVSLVTASFAVESSLTPHPTLLTYLPAPVAVQLESMPLAHVTEAIHSLFLDNLPRAAGVETKQPIVSELTSWSKDPYALGATSTPVIDADEVTPLNFVELGKPEWQGRLLFAGEHTSLNNRGSVTGAVETGEKEGKRAVRLLNAQT
jgi:monoamine oxidase